MKILELLHTTHFILIIIMLVLALVSFIFLFFFTAPYGRYVESHNTNNYKLVPKHIGWLIMEVPAVLTILIVWILSDVGLKGILYGKIELQSFFSYSVFLFIWEFHYIYRTFIATFLAPEVKKSFRYYVVIMGAIFNIINGFINGWYLFFYMPTKVLGSQHNIGANLFDTHFIIGIAIFILGFIIHVKSDVILRQVKLENHGNYGIPNAFLHKYVASPNYLGEIIQWTGWAILTWSLAGLTFAIFTFANLAPRAYSNLKWYKSKFQEYPKNRKALFPFIL